MKVIRIKTIEDAIDAYFEHLRSEGLEQASINQPARDDYEQTAEGWILRNVNGNLALVTDDGEVIPGEVLTFEEAVEAYYADLEYDAICPHCYKSTLDRSSLPAVSEENSEMTKHGWRLRTIDRILADVSFDGEVMIEH